MRYREYFGVGMPRLTGAVQHRAKKPIIKCSDNFSVLLRTGLSCDIETYVQGLQSMITLIERSSLHLRKAFPQLTGSNRKAVLSQGNRDAVLFGLMFADIQYTFKSSQAPKSRLQSSRHTGEKNRI